MNELGLRIDQRPLPQRAHRQEHVVDLIEGNPVADFILIIFKQRECIADIQIDHLFVDPAMIFQRDGQWNIAVRESNHRFNVVFL